MATRKTHDLVVKTGTYNNQQGENKNRYENIGSMMEGDNGSFMILKRTFNPAGLANPENKDSIIVSLFEVDNQQQRHQGNSQPPQAQQQAPMPDDDFHF